MKKLLLSTLVSGMILMICHPAFAQSPIKPNKKHVPEWTPEQGYWVVVGNQTTPKINTIYFYNEENELVYKENLVGVRLQLKKAKVKMQLKLALEKALSANKKHRMSGEDQKLVFNILKKK